MRARIENDAEVLVHTVQCLREARCRRRATGAQYLLVGLVLYDGVREVGVGAEPLPQQLGLQSVTNVVGRTGTQREQEATQARAAVISRQVGRRLFVEICRAVADEI